MGLLGKELIAIIVSHQLFYVFQCYRPIVPGSKSLVDYGPRGYVVATRPGVDFLQDFLPFFRCDAFEENTR